MGKWLDNLIEANLTFALLEISFQLLGMRLTVSTSSLAVVGWGNLNNCPNNEFQISQPTVTRLIGLLHSVKIQNISN
jgi:hypothetical protein